MFREGSQIGSYTLIRKLGRGGFGEIWLAEKRSQFVTKKVAVKLPHEEQVNFDAIRQEATLWEQASGHPNVLPIIDADIYDGQVVIVSEYADGGSLTDRLKREGKLPLQQAVEMTIGILNGLHFLHSRKIIHRDIKPQNILLQDDMPRLADFGISRAMNTTIISSAIIGTDAYMSPESFDGKRNVQTDIWSVGVVLYQLLKGSLPFLQEHPSERMFAVLTKEFALLPDEIPNELRKIVQKALQKQPENRYRTAIEMREDLKKVLIGIAHPTLAKTEILHKPILPNLDSNAPTLVTNEQTLQTNEPVIQADAPTSANNFQSEETEIRTIVSSKPDNQPAPTQPAYQQNPVADKIKPTFVAETQPAIAAELARKTATDDFQITGKPLPAKPVWKFKTPYIIAGFVAVFLLIIVISSILNSDGKYDPGLEAFMEGGKTGYKDSNGNVIIPAKYEAGTQRFSEGLAAVKLNEKWGYINDKDTIVIPFKYDSLREGFGDGLAAVQLNNKWGFIDKTGEEIIPFRFGDVSFFIKGWARACLNKPFEGGCGVIDKTGKEVVPLKYDIVTDDYNGFFSDGYVEVKHKGRKYRVDKYGNETEMESADH